MDGASLSRLRWRLHGAWMWPTFIVLTALDGAIGHWLPPTGDSWSPIGAYLLGFFLSLIGIVVGGPALGALIRRFRTDMPKVVARDYAGTAAVTAITAIMLGLGLGHRAQISADRRALADAVARAEAYIGDRAPPGYRTNLGRATTFVIQAPRFYRTCVPDRQGTRSYCVVVDRHLPFSRSVRPAGSEPNSVFSQGVS